MQAAAQNFRNTNEHIPDEFCSYTNLVVMPYVGYSWYPFKVPFYVKPIIGLGYSSLVGGTNTISVTKAQVMQVATYHLESTVPYASIHVGFTFK